VTPFILYSPDCTILIKFNYDSLFICNSAIVIITIILCCFAAWLSNQDKQITIISHLVVNLSEAFPMSTSSFMQSQDLSQLMLMSLRWDVSYSTSEVPRHRKCTDPNAQFQCVAPSLFCASGTTKGNRNNGNPHCKSKADRIILKIMMPKLQKEREWRKKITPDLIGWGWNHMSLAQFWRLRSETGNKVYQIVTFHCPYNLSCQTNNPSCCQKSWCVASRNCCYRSRSHRWLNRELHLISLSVSI